MYFGGIPLLFTTFWADLAGLVVKMKFAQENGWNNTKHPPFGRNSHESFNKNEAPPFASKWHTRTSAGDINPSSFLFFWLEFQAKTAQFL